VLFFVDNIFRFTQAGSEVSALLGRIPSAVGYQPTLATDMGALQERITSTKGGLDHLVQADLRAGGRPDRPGAGDPSPTSTPPRFCPRDLRARHLPGRGPARLDLAHPRPAIVGEEHYQVARDVQGILQRYKSLQDIIAILGMDELSEEDKLTVAAPGRSSASCRSPSTWRRCSPARPACRCRWKRPSPLQGAGRDHLPAMVGDIRPPARSGLLHGRRHRGRDDRDRQGRSWRRRAAARPRPGPSTRMPPRRLSPILSI
jgi:hypothetical protein